MISAIGVILASFCTLLFRSAILVRFSMHLIEVFEANFYALMVLILFPYFQCYLEVYSAVLFPTPPLSREFWV